MNFPQPVPTDPRKALGIREADCGCCYVVDMRGLNDLLAERRAGTLPTPHRDFAEDVIAVFQHSANDDLGVLESVTDPRAAWVGAFDQAARIVRNKAARREPMWHTHADSAKKP